MDFSSGGFGEDERDIRWCFMRVDAIRRALQNVRVLDALIDVLDVPVTTVSLRSMSPDDKVNAIERQIAHHRGTPSSMWFQVSAPEVLASAIYLSELPRKMIYGEMLHSVKKEGDLTAAVARWLSNRGDVYAEVPLGTKRVDVLSFKNHWFSGCSITAVELKNDLKQFERGLDQMTTYSDYAHETYLACTPAMAAEYLATHFGGRAVKHWDPGVLKSKLQKFGFGLLLVEGEAVIHHIKPRSSAPPAHKISELDSAVKRMPVAVRMR